ncbi:hypothetical protein MLD38_016522 [Melastoma candidum]|uniref:Uncharacterized protein n=1 Tax=Melastoma candidum TaxID=119954 RepID=A0ACB9QQS9_9MYRT|nr:hypothetical protein MLD38_016522 [Melastoma candidum]
MSGSVGFGSDACERCGNGFVFHVFMEKCELVDDSILLCSVVSLLQPGMRRLLAELGAFRELACMSTTEKSSARKVKTTTFKSFKNRGEEQRCRNLGAKLSQAPEFYFGCRETGKRSGAAVFWGEVEKEEEEMTLKVYADRMSQPSRAIIIFCKLNGIEFEEVKVDIAKRQHLSSEFKEINPMRQVPAIVDGRFKLFESHAILIYLAGVFPGVADHWYPADLFKRAKVQSVLDWHHGNLRRGAAGFVLNSALAPALGLPLNPQAAAEAEKLLSSSLLKLETIWLKGKGPFLLGGFQPTIADLSLVCEIMQLEVVEEDERQRILGPYQKVQKWMESTRKATQPHFDDVHEIVFKVKTKLQQIKQSGGESKRKLAGTSRL